MSRALFYVVALVAGPILGTLAGLFANGEGASVRVAWLVWFGLPAAVTALCGWALRRTRFETLVVAGASSLVAFVGVFLFVVYLVSDVS